MTRWLAKSGYDAESAASADEALDHLAGRFAAVALCDLRMPERDGLWLASQIRDRFPETAIIIATGAREFDAAVSGLRLGVSDFLAKPFTRETLTHAVERGVDWHRAAVEDRTLRDGLRTRVQKRQQQLASALLQLEITSEAAIGAMLHLVTLHDPAAYVHARRVAALAVRIAESLGMSEADTRTVQRGALPALARGSPSTHR